MEPSPQAPDNAPLDHLAGRRDTLRLLGLSGLGALAALGQPDHAVAENQDRAQRRRERRKRREQRSSAQVEKKKKRAGTPGPTGPMGPTGPAGGATGPTGPAALAGDASDVVAAIDAVTSSTFGDLGTPGPSVTVDVPDSGRVLVILTARMVLVAPVTGCMMSFETTQGNGNYAPDRSRSIAIASDAGLLDVTTSAVFVLPQISPGPHTFTAKYARFLGGVGDPSCDHRALVVIPLP